MTVLQNKPKKVLIVGAGPSGLATAACLSASSIPYTILEREDCYASLWQKRAYDRLGLHLAKSFCSLPFMPHLSTTPTFMPKATFLSYLENYVSKFNINPLYRRSVELASYDEGEKQWRVEAKNFASGETEVFYADFLVIASGENDEAFIPKVHGLETFEGEIIHSSQYKCGEKYKDKHILVVGSGNSGMEISDDLSDYGACTCVVIRSPFHVLTKRMVHVGMWMLKFMPVEAVDLIISLVARFSFGDLSKIGIPKPKKGPFQLKTISGKTPVIDTGSIEKIRNKKIKVLPGLVEVKRNKVVFENGEELRFDAIIFATGYRSAAKNWLKEDGMPKNEYPSHWQGEKGLYCAGMSGRGLSGVSSDAINIANHIAQSVSHKKEKDDVTLLAFFSKFHFSF
ncbi:hypothetical protein FEM48_Zijuj08G0188100 [Ziziphus jujuba var. spinosa]|uniref:Flavin-containing monooxygenase n=1 Tax=Ziziphus jujuba var. spinosa TaxID=714518 RepID=A0A978V0R9_ZIZJJ|nr:hypothetical protein FEM48_Zijuj08G0188100 [Ziziphus jujuba var. spinosa]